jgi:hypothetical protein
VLLCCFERLRCSQAQQKGRYFLTKAPSISCYNCKRIGHFASSCPYEKVMRPPSRTEMLLLCCGETVPALQADIPCSLCAQTGHATFRCPNELCFRCGGVGHQGRVRPSVVSWRRSPFAYFAGVCVLARIAQKSIGERTNTNGCWNTVFPAIACCVQATITILRYFPPGCAQCNIPCIAHCQVLCRNARQSPIWRLQTVLGAAKLVTW